MFPVTSSSPPSALFYELIIWDFAKQQMNWGGGVEVGVGNWHKARVPGSRPVLLRAGFVGLVQAGTEMDALC